MLCVKKLTAVVMSDMEVGMKLTSLKLWQLALGRTWRDIWNNHFKIKVADIKRNSL